MRLQCGLLEMELSIYRKKKQTSLANCRMPIIASLEARRAGSFMLYTGQVEIKLLLYE